MRHLKDTQIKVMIEKSEGRKDRKHFEMKGVYHVELCIMLHKETY